MRSIAGLLLALCIFTPAVADEYYRSLDTKGRTHYGDQPLPDAVDYDLYKSTAEPAADGPVPYLVQRAVAAHPVVLYTSDDCGEICKSAAAFLLKRGIPYSMVQLSSSEDIDQFKTRMHSDRVPTLTIGSDMLKGFAQSVWSEKLDQAGYPSSAPYGYRPRITNTTISPK